MIYDFIRPQIPRLGKIRLGEKAISSKGSEYPKDTGFFHLPPEVAEVYGADKVKELTVMVPSVDISKFFPYELKRYGNDKLICHGDGRDAKCFNTDTGEWEDIECGYHDCPFFNEKKCSEVGNLMVILPDVSIFGVYQIDTGSWYGINDIYNAFESFLQSITDITGDPKSILQVKFKLVRQERVLTFVDKGVRKNSTKAILNLIPPALSYNAALQLAAHINPQSPMLTVGGRTPAPALPNHDDEELRHGAEVELPDVNDAPMPKDLYPGASPIGPDMGQRTAWAALLEIAQNMGRSVDAIEKSVVQQTSPGATAFADLTGAEEAPDALARLTKMIENWQKEEAKAEKAADPKPATKPATTIPTPQPEVSATTTDNKVLEGSLEF